MRKVWFWILRRMSEAARLTSGSGTKGAESVRSLCQGTPAATQSSQAGCQEFFPTRMLDVPDLKRDFLVFSRWWILIRIRDPDPKRQK
jgi:hypothetical protein